MRRTLGFPQVWGIGADPEVGLGASLDSLFARARPCSDSFTTLAEDYAYVGLISRTSPLPAAVAADVLSKSSWVLMFASLTTLAFLFPDGRLLPGRRWKRIGVGATVAFSGAWVGSTMKPGLQSAPFDHYRNPVGVSWLHGPGVVLVAVFMLAMLASIVAAAVSVVTRFRRSTGIERRQLVLFAFAAALLPASLAACFVGLAISGTDAIGAVVVTGVSVLMPLAVGVAVLRYRLYDIGRLINRTIVYASSTPAAHRGLCGDQPARRGGAGSRYEPGNRVLHAGGCPGLPTRQGPGPKLGGPAL